MWSFRKCAVIVAHPDDEMLWSGGTILMHPECEWTIVTLCRKRDQDRAPRFFRVIEKLNAIGTMGDLDDGPEQHPLKNRQVQHEILQILPSGRYDLIITHGLHGEYTHHLRHEETAQAVMALWKSDRLSAGQIWRFAYDDIKLPETIWQEKYDIITNIYGFKPDSFEARATPREEAFWCFKSVQKH
jgi:LmbE family N-acetylglucosaminyl deacetylase